MKLNNRHYAGRVYFQRYILTDSTVLTVSDHSLGILYRYFAHSLYEGDGGNEDEEENHNLNEEHESSAIGLVESLRSFSEDREGQTRDDTDHNDQGDTVTDTPVGNTLAEPHHEHRTCHQHDGCKDIESETLY